MFKKSLVSAVRANVSGKKIAQANSALAKKLITDFISLLSSKVARQTDMHDQIITKALPRMNDPRQSMTANGRWICLSRTKAKDQFLCSCGVYPRLSPLHTKKKAGINPAATFLSLLELSKHFIVQRPFAIIEIYPYLLNSLDINHSNQVWCSDITYVRMSGGFVYKVAVMDWHSRKVLSWEISVTMDDSFCVSALESAIRRYGKPEIFNTDQGSQYTGKAFTDVLKDNDIKISMDGKGRAMDNIMIERLWRTVKYEEIFLKDYASVLDLIHSLTVYFTYYNNERSLDDLTPTEKYDSSFNISEAI